MRKLLGALALILLAAVIASCSPQPAQTAEADAYLDIPAESYALNSESIPYAIVNNSGQTIYVQLIPRLERETAVGWQALEPEGVGFCGVPDSIESRWEDSLPLAWYANALTPGQYRLSFQAVDGQDYAPEGLLSDTFILEEATAWISPDRTVDMTNLNVYWQADNLQFPVDENATLNVYVRAEKNDDGEFAFDDGQDWLVLLETSAGDFALFPREFVQLGVVSCTVFKDIDDAFHVLVTVRQSAGHRIYDCVFDAEQNAFKAIPVYEARGINYIVASP